jgi:hypothetical protein
VLLTSMYVSCVSLQGRVLRSWGPVHVITQILGLLAAVGGVTIAILAFGWKDVPGQKLYTPHKWAGVGVMGMAIVQVRVWPCTAVQQYTVVYSSTPWCTAVHRVLLRVC